MRLIASLLLLVSFAAHGQVETPFVIIGPYAGQSCNVPPWNNSTWTVGVPTAADLVCSAGAVSGFGTLADTALVVTCFGVPGTPALTCSAAGESTEPASSYRAAPPNPPQPPVFTGTSTLSWTAPTTNTDGSPLTNLAAYRVYWGMTQGTYPNSVSLGNPTLTTYVVSNLAPGTWYFVVTAVASTGAESAFSAPASKVIEDGAPQPADPCIADPFAFLVRSWPGGVTGDRSLGYSNNKPIARIDLTQTATRVIGVRATDTRGCVVAVMR